LFQRHPISEVWGWGADDYGGVLKGDSSLRQRQGGFELTAD